MKKPRPRSKRKPAAAPAAPTETRPDSTSAATIVAEENRTTAVQLRRGGATYREIGKALHVSHVMARKYVLGALRRAHKDLMTRTGALIALEHERLELPLKQLAVTIAAGPSPGREALWLGAIEQWRKLSESRRKLLGLDAAAAAADPEDPDAPPAPGEVLDVDCIVIEVGRKLSSGE